MESRGTVPESWRVELPIFEGPLDLLLHLVRINQVEIADIPVALVCDQFHDYLQIMEELNLDIAAEYIYEAALLIHLKSRLLLPRPADGAEASGEDPQQELVERLLEYQKMKGAAQSLAEIHSIRRGIWSRPPRPLPALGMDEEETVDLGEVSLYDLLGALRTVLVRYEREHPDPLRLRGETFSVRDQFERLIAAMESGGAFDLVDDLRRRSGRAEVVAAFLAVLELARLHLIRLHQTEGGDVLLYRTQRELEQHELEAIQS